MSSTSQVGTLKEEEKEEGRQVGNGTPHLDDDDKVVVPEELDSVTTEKVRLLESRVKELEEALAVKTTEVNVINVQLKEANEKLLKYEVPQVEEEDQRWMRWSEESPLIFSDEDLEDTVDEEVTPPNDDISVSSVNVTPTKPPALLTYLPKLQDAGITDLLLEFINTGESGPQSVLNLRKVHRDTKDWIDTLRPSLRNRIFFKIPIKFSLDDGDDDLERFHECPPPPSATSMIIFVPIDADWDQVDKPYVMPEEWKAKLIQAKEDFPTFFTFWTKRMQTLKINNCYSAELLDIVGYPSSLRNLDCTKICDANPHASLFQVEILTINSLSLFTQDSEQELTFYRRLAANRNLKRLRMIIRLDEAKVDSSRNLLAGIQLLIDARRNDAHFELVVEFDGFKLDGVDDDDADDYRNLRGFVSSVAASSSTIRMFGCSGQEIWKINEIFTGSESDFKIARDFFKCVEKIIGVEELRGLRFLLEENAFPNLKCTSTDLYAIENDVVLPNYVEYVGINSGVYFPPMMIRGNWPALLKAVHVDLSDSLPGTVEEWIASLTSMSKECPLLNKLSIDNFKVTNSELYQWTAPEENIPQYSFSNLKSLTLSLGFVLDEELEGWGSSISTSNLLLHVFQVQQMSLLKFNLYCKEYPIQLVIDADCVESILNSPLAKSLVSTNLAWFIPKDASEAEYKFTAVVHENRRKREEKLGRQGRRRHFFEFDIHSPKWWK